MIEILSPATAERDRTYKRTLCAKYGVKEYWLIDPKRKTIEVLVLMERGFEAAGIHSPTEVLASPLLPGLSIDLRKVF